MPVAFLVQGNDHLIIDSPLQVLEEGFAGIVAVQAWGGACAFGHFQLRVVTLEGVYRLADVLDNLIDGLEASCAQQHDKHEHRVSGSVVHGTGGNRSPYQAVGMMIGQIGLIVRTQGAASELGTLREDSRANWPASESLQGGRRASAAASTIPALRNSLM